MNLFKSVIQGNIEYLKDNLNINNINSIEFDHSLLQEAIVSKNKDISELLINFGIDVNIRNDNGSTALHYCASRGYQLYNIAQLILDNGGDLSISDKHGNQPLWTACYESKGKYLDMVKLFMDYGAEPSHENRYGKSPIDIAKIMNNSNLLDILLKN